MTKEAADAWRPLAFGNGERALLRALNAKGAEFRVLATDFSERLELRIISPGLEFFHAVPEHDDGALGCLAIKSGYLFRVSPSGSANGKKLPPCDLMRACCFGAYSFP